MGELREVMQKPRNGKPFADMTGEQLLPCVRAQLRLQAHAGKAAGGQRGGGAASRAALEEVFSDVPGSGPGDRAPEAGP